MYIIRDTDYLSKIRATNILTRKFKRKNESKASFLTLHNWSLQPFGQDMTYYFRLCCVC